MRLINAPLYNSLVLTVIYRVSLMTIQLLEDIEQAERAIFDEKKDFHVGAGGSCSEMIKVVISSRIIDLLTKVLKIAYLP